MSQFHHHLIYCTDNQAVVGEITNDLRTFGHSFSLHGISEKPDSLALSNLDLDSTNGKVVLLVTDNFLKNANCLHGAQPLVRKWAEAGLLVTVVAPGTTTGQQGNEEPVETSFDRVSQIIQYMNHWQDKYLDYRKLKRREDDSEELDEQIAVTKEISADVGELLRFLRSLDPFTLEQFQDKSYARFRLGAGEKITLSADDEDENLEPSDAERKLVQMIEGSSDDLIAENSELDQRFEGIEDELTDAEENVPDEVLAEIPGISMLDEKQAEADNAPDDVENLDAEAASLMDELLMQQDEEDVSAESPDQPEQPPSGRSTTSEPVGEHDEDNAELESLLDEVLDDEFDDDDTDFKFLSEDSDEEVDFDIDSIFEDDENILHEEDDTEAADEDEVVLDLLDEEDDEAFVATAAGKRASPEEVLEHALDLFSDGRTEEGLAHLQSTLEANPSNTTLRYYFAYSLARYANDMEGAKRHLEILLKQDHRHPEAWYLLGELAENQEDYEGARKCFEKAIGINPDYPDIYYRLGLLTVQHFPGEEKQAAKWFRRAIDEDNQNADAEYALANLLGKRLGEPKKAAKHFLRTLAIQPDHPYANYDLALLYYQQGDRQLANKFYQKATALNPALKTEQNDAAFRLDGPGGKLSAQEVAAASNSEDPGAKSAAAVISTAMEVVPEVETQDEAEAQQQLITAAATATELKKPGNGAIVLISGGTAGIGRATAEIFAKNGYRVIITGRREGRLEEIKNSLAETYDADIQALAFDVRDAAALQKALDTLPDAWREVEILINNAGLSQGLAPIHEGELAHWDTMIDTNVKGLLYLTRAVVPHMVARRRGTVINVCSGAAKEVYPGGNVYCATKSAVEALTKGMRLDLYQHNIRVGQVSPGHVEETEFAQVRFEGDEDRAAKTYDNFQPLRASDVAEAIYFMASRPAHVNIHDIFLNGTQQASSNFIDRSGRGE